MKWAVSSNGVGNPVSARAIEDDWSLADNEIFTVPEDAFEHGMVLNQSEDALENPQ